jgi:hypothetical protein
MDSRTKVRILVPKGHTPLVPQFYKVSTLDPVPRPRNPFDPGSLWLCSRQSKKHPQESWANLWFLWISSQRSMSNWKEVPQLWQWAPWSSQGQHGHGDCKLTSTNSCISSWWCPLTAYKVREKLRPEEPNCLETCMKYTEQVMRE